MNAPQPRNSKFILRLALVSGLILLIGAFFRPQRNSSSAPPPPPSGADLARLARLSQRRTLENLTAYFGAVADDVAPSLIYIPGSRATGTMWSPGLAVSPSSGGRMPDSLTAMVSRREIIAHTTILSPQLPLVGIELPGARDVPTVKRADVLPGPGDWILAVWQTDEGRAFAPGTFAGTRTASCGEWKVHQILTTLVFPPAAAGGGLFDLDGGVIAVVLPCRERLVPIAPSDIDAMLSSAETLEARLLGRQGLRVGQLTQDEALHFKTQEGAIVREVWIGYPAERAGLWPGDIIQAIDGTAVRTSDDLGLLAARETQAAVLTVQRLRKTTTVTLDSNAESRPEVVHESSTAGLVWEPPPSGSRIESVVPMSAAARAGIQPGDRLLRINHVEPRSLRDLRRLLAGSLKSPVFVEIERDGRRWGVLLS